MVVTDLMLGNIVQYVSDRMPVAPVTISKTSSNGHLRFEEYPNEYPMIGDILGYPLTDDLLKKLGFQMKDGVFTNHEYDIIKEDGSYYFVGVKIQYLHELQNMFTVMFQTKLPIDRRYL